MKKTLLILAILPLFFGCGSNTINNTNPYIPNYSVNATINLSLPLYSNLLYPSYGVYIPNYGAKGLIVFNIGNGNFNAFDAACPNQTLSACSTMTVKDNNAICPCDNAVYDLYSGQCAGKQYLMKQYRVEVNGNLIHVYN